jgi:hypothetical protein
MIIMFKGEDGVFPFLPIGYPMKKVVLLSPFSNHILFDLLANSSLPLPSTSTIQFE